MKKITGNNNNSDVCVSPLAWFTWQLSNSNIGTFIIQNKKTQCSTPSFYPGNTYPACSSFLKPLISSKKFKHHDNNTLSSFQYWYLVTSCMY
jgi:hypothetical protein